MARDVTLYVRITDSGAKAVDSMRGDWSRSEYVRQALARAIKAGLRGPQGTDL